MTSMITSASAAGLPPQAVISQGATARSAGQTGFRQDQLAEDQRLARLTGLLFLITYATSIPATLSFYVPALSDPAFILGGGFDPTVSWGAFLELLLILANIGSALTL